MPTAELIGPLTDELSRAGRSLGEMIAFSVRGPIALADLPGLCERICALLASRRGEVAWCDVADVAPDAVTVDALARLQVAAQRAGCSIRLRNASPELRELVAFMGLGDVVA